MKEGHTYTFFQTVRLLKLLAMREGEVAPGGDPLTGAERTVSIRPSVALDFPESDVERVTFDDEHKAQLTATFLGLYGVSSPLPNFYSEDVIDEHMNDRSVIRDFLDIVHKSLYPLFYGSWAKYQLFFRVAEERDPDAIGILESLVGIYDPSVRDHVDDPYGLLRYAGLLTQRPRSALGLETLLGDALGAPGKVEVIQCVERIAKIPQDQWLSLGKEAPLGAWESSVALGEGACLGSQVEDRAGQITIRIGPLSSRSLHQLLPGEPWSEKMGFLVNYYMVEPLTTRVELWLKGKSAQTACLGFDQWNRLGMNTWLFSGEYDDDVTALFEL